MFCATVFLPSHIIEFTNISASVDPYTGSAAISLGSGLRLRGIYPHLLLRSGFWPLGAVFRTALLPAADAGGVQRSSHDVVAHTRQILHTATADEHDRVLLQVVPDAGNIGCDLDPVGQAYSSDLA